MTDTQRLQAVTEALDRVPCDVLPCDSRCPLATRRIECHSLCMWTQSERQAIARALTAPQSDWRDDVVRALKALLPDNWGVVKSPNRVLVYTPEHSRVVWFMPDWREEDCDKHAIMAAVAHWLDTHHA